MGKNPIISFVIPAYNEENYISECLESILKEISRENIPAEIIVVNNRSTDNTLKIASKYPNVRVINEPIRGIIRARQRGFLAARGELIANIDADVRLPKNWLKKVLREFRSNKDLVCLSGPQVYQDTSLALKSTVVMFYFMVMATYIIGRYILDQASVVQGGNFIIKKQALRELGGYNHHLNFYGEDVDVATRFHKIGDIKFSLFLPVDSSARRVAKEGLLKTALKYSSEYIAIAFFNKNLFKDYLADVRLEKNAKVTLLKTSKKEIKTLSRFFKIFSSK